MLATVARDVPTRRPGVVTITRYILARWPGGVVAAAGALDIRVVARGPGVVTMTRNIVARWPGVVVAADGALDIRVVPVPVVARRPGVVATSSVHVAWRQFGVSVVTMSSRGYSRVVFLLSVLELGALVGAVLVEFALSFGLPGFSLGDALELELLLQVLVEGGALDKVGDAEGVAKLCVVLLLGTVGGV